MAEKINLFSDQWVDIVFQNKNHLYGAYDLRKTSSRRHAKAVAIAVGFFLIAILSPILINEISKGIREKDDRVRVLTDIKLDRPKDKEIPKPLTPPPPKIRNTVKFVPPVIKPDEEVPEDEKPILVEEINKVNTAIGAEEVKGGTDELIPVETPAEVEEPFVAVEQMPEFEGGERAMNNFVTSNIRYPVIALENGISGRVILRFVVDKNGEISQVTVLRGIGGGCDEEAIRIVKRMPRWKPGKQGGRSVPVWFTLPIAFTIAQ
jgi:protein TonB